MAESKPLKHIPAPNKRRKIWRVILIVLGIVSVCLIGARLALPSFVRWKVNQVLNQSPLYAGKIEDVRINLWRGAYSILGVTITKTSGNIPVPLFSSKKVDLALQWDALWAGAFVGEVVIYEPDLHFVDAPDEANAQTGASGPWLEMIRDLFPLKINKATIENGAIRFHAFHKSPPVDLYTSHVNIVVTNLTNIHNEMDPLIATVIAEGLVMDQGKFEYRMKLDPFSYYPTFQLTFRLLGLDVTKMNDLTRAYGKFDYERGWFDLVIELDATEGRIEGYVKPLYRNIRILSLEKDMAEDNVIEFFWEALVGGVTAVLTNQRRHQFGTKIPVAGNLTQPQPAVLEALGNVFRNAFIRAYLPRISPRKSEEIHQSVFAPDDSVQFGRGFVMDSLAPSDSGF
jgi:hypothetical protein